MSFTRVARGILVAGGIASSADAQARDVACSATPPTPREADTTLRLDINLPAYRVDLSSAGQLTATFRVAIGARKYKTPVGHFAVTSVEWNPWWIPPRSEWARKDTVTPPGPTNPMGRVKLWFGPMYFVHGSPVPQSIGHAASHGCVRMRNGDAVDLAARVLELAAPTLDSIALASMRRDTTTTRTIPLPRPVPLTTRYDVVEVRLDTLWVYPDVYRRGAATVALALKVLASTGVDTLRVERKALGRLVASGRRKAAGLAIRGGLVGGSGGLERNQLVPGS